MSKGRKDAVEYNRNGVYLNNKNHASDKFLVWFVDLPIVAYLSA